MKTRPSLCNGLTASGIRGIDLPGVATAIKRTVRHATGIRLRELPVMIEIPLT